MTARAKVIGADYDIALRFEAVLPLNNCYSLGVEMSWANQEAIYRFQARRFTCCRWLVLFHELGGADF